MKTDTLKFLTERLAELMAEVEMTKQAISIFEKSNPAEMIKAPLMVGYNSNMTYEQKIDFVLRANMQQKMYAKEIAQYIIDSENVPEPLQQIVFDRVTHMCSVMGASKKIQFEKNGNKNMYYLPA
jgi:hypothetical protein